MKKRWPAFLAILVLVVGVFVYIYFLHPETAPMWAEFDPADEQAQSMNSSDDKMIDATDSTDALGSTKGTETTNSTTEMDSATEEATPVFKPVKVAPKVEEPTTYLFFGQDRVVQEENGEAIESVETELILTATLEPKTREIQIQFIPPNTLHGESELQYLYGQEGIQALETAVEGVTDQRVQNYIGVDYQSFEQLIDVLGGIDIELNETINMPRYGLVIEPGMNHLNGAETLKLVRLKYGKTTIMERIERQKLILSAIYQKMSEMRNLSELKEVSDSVLKIRQDLQTDLDGSQILKGFQFFTQGVNHLSVEVLPGELVEEGWIPKDQD